MDVDVIWSSSKIYHWFNNECSDLVTAQYPQLENCVDFLEYMAKMGETFAHNGMNREWYISTRFKESIIVAEELSDKFEYIMSDDNVMSEIIERYEHNFGHGLKLAFKPELYIQKRELTEAFENMRSMRRLICNTFTMQYMKDEHFRDLFNHVNKINFTYDLDSDDPMIDILMFYGHVHHDFRYLDKYIDDKYYKYYDADYLKDFAKLNNRHQDQDYRIFIYHHIRELLKPRNKLLIK